MRVAILHPDRTAAERLSALLERAGHTPVAFISGQALHDAMNREAFAALLMRWDGPGLSGVALLHRLRARLATPPCIIMLVDAAAPGAIAEAADHLLDDPCSESALNAALAALAGRSSQAPHRLEQFEDMVFDTAGSQARVGGQTVPLTAKEFALALFLMRNCGHAVSRDKIMRAVWGRQELPGSRTLDAHVAQVRKRLLLRPERGWQLRSIYGVGYRLDRVDQA